MKSFFCSALLAAALVTPALADLTIVQQVEGVGPLAQVTMKLKGDKARIEASPQMTSIFDAKTGEMLNLLHDQKMVMRTSAAQAKAAGAAMAAASGKAAPEAPAGKVKVTATGKKETINGYETEEYQADAAGYKASYWVAKNYPQGDVILKQLQSMTPEAFSAGAMAAPDFHDFPGLPLRTNVTMGGTKVVSTITAVKMDSLDDSEFTVPAGYKEMKMPDMSSILGGKTDAAKAPKAAAAPTP